MNELKIKRGQFALTVRTETDEPISLMTSGGTVPTPAEYDQIAEFVAGDPDAERFLGKLKARMER